MVIIPTVEARPEIETIDGTSSARGSLDPLRTLEKGPRDRGFFLHLRRGARRVQGRAVTAQFLQVTPFMHVADVDAAVAFFRDLLGFAVPFAMPGYAYVEREGCGLRILEAGEGNALLPGQRRFRYYFDVSDVDALHAELKPALGTLPPRDVHGPADKPYGQRELLVLAPDGDLVCFGQSLFDARQKVPPP